MLGQRNGGGKYQAPQSRQALKDKNMPPASSNRNETTIFSQTAVSGNVAEPGQEGLASLGAYTDFAVSIIVALTHELPAYCTSVSLLPSISNVWARQTVYLLFVTVLHL